MIEVQLSNRAASGPIIFFDGRVIELFSDDLREGSRRLHISHLQSVEILPAVHGTGRYSLQMKGEYQLIAMDVSESALPKARELVTAIQQAMASLKS